MFASKQKRKVRVYIENGPTIEGVLAGKTRDAYVLWAPGLVVDEKEPNVEVTGHVEIPRGRVLWYQVLG